MKALARSFFALGMMVVILFLMPGCESNEIKGIFIDNKEIDLKQWVKKNHIEGKDYELYTYTVENGDTATFLSIWKFPVSDSSMIKYTYKKRFEDQDFKYFLIGDNDTLAYYKQSKVNPDSLYFFKGKYYYDYKHFNLTPGQAEYFENNYDSLIDLRGDDLPSLPEDPILARE